ncbi:MAG: 2-C-methyl-D-erythritol 4-phosphate cytidylyltransferase [Melioribacteraceae bacterium]|jgi:2-C-methyl-D-erythritol 4-phosphate cytidylyltransferase
MKTYVIIPSGGSGKRASSSMPKQYIQFNGKELIAYTLDLFQKCELVDGIIIAAKKDFFELLSGIKKKYSFSKISQIVEGGAERQNSVLNALRSLNAADDDLIIVHDAVRPLLPSEILIESIGTARKYGSAVVAIRARDTLIRGNDTVIDYINREEIFYAQTPQVFRYGILLEAMLKCEQDGFLGTDESMLVHRIQKEVKIVAGSTLNFKITNNDDIKLFKLIIENRV